MPKRNKEIANITIAIISGIGTAIGVFFLLFAFFIATGLLGWSDGGEKKYLDRLEKTTNISLFFSIVASLVAGIFNGIRIHKKAKS